MADDPKATPPPPRAARRWSVVKTPRRPQIGASCIPPEIAFCVATIYQNVPLYAQFVTDPRAIEAIPLGSIVVVVDGITGCFHFQTEIGEASPISNVRIVDQLKRELQKAGLEFGWKPLTMHLRQEMIA